MATMSDDTALCFDREGLRQFGEDVNE